MIARTHFDLGERFGYFIFFWWGEGKGEFKAPGGVWGVGFSLRKSGGGGGGFSQERGEGARRREGGRDGTVGGRGLLSGPKFPLFVTGLAGRNYFV